VEGRSKLNPCRLVLESARRRTTAVSAQLYLQFSRNSATFSMVNELILKGRSTATLSTACRMVGRKLTACDSLSPTSEGSDPSHQQFEKTQET